MLRTRHFVAVLCTVIAGLGALAFSGLASASTASTAAPHIKNGGTVTLLLTAVWPSLDPASPTITPNEALTDPALEPLFFQTNAGLLQPDLALSSKATDGGLLITLQLRHGVKFQDGTPFNAQAVVWNLQRYTSPSVASECVAYLAIMSSVNAVGKYEVQIHLTQPDSGFTYLLSALQCGLMVSPTAVQSEGSAFGTSSAVVGTGPFSWQSGTAGTRAVFTRFNGYWGPRAHLASVVMEEVGSTTAAYDAMTAGQANLWPNLDAPNFLGESQQSGQFVVAKTPAIGITYVAPVFNKPPFNNVTARQALFYATDTASIIKEIELNIAKPVEGVFPPNMFAYNGKVAGYSSYNLTKAKSLVQEADTQLGGKGMTFTLSCSNVPTVVTICEALQAQWQAAGMNVQISSYAGPTFISGVHSLAYQAYEITNPALPDPDLVAYRWFYSTSPLSQNGDMDPTADKYILEGRQSFRVSTRLAAYTALDKVLETKDFVWDDLYALPYFTSWAKNVGGVTASSYQMYRWQNMYIKS